MNTEKLRASDIVKIIDSCKRNGVVQFTFKELSISFAPSYNTEQIDNPAITSGFSYRAGEEPIKPFETEKIERQISKELETLDELMLSNPTAYEEALNAREPEG